LTFNQSFKLASGDAPVREGLIFGVGGNKTGNCLIKCGF
jgi:hypothetical protein